MKRVNNIYYKICDVNNIIDMEHKISVSVKNKSRVEKYEEYYSENIYKIKDILESKNYIPGEYNIFFVKEPKLRLIMSQNIEDKIINHLVARYFLVDVFDKSFIDTTVATRVNKGTLVGLKYTKKYIYEMKRKYNNFYYLKFDIKKYFYNIDHNVVKEMIRKKKKDKDALNLLNIIIDSTNSNYINKKIIELKNKEINKIRSSNVSEKEKIIKIKEIEEVPLCNKDKGLPIGSMCSQVLAVLYLDELNHYIKEKLHIKYYVLYMDDGILFYQDKEYLKYCLEEIERYLDNIKLKLNMKKTQINNISNGIAFLGFRFIFINNRLIMKVRNDTKTRFRNKIRLLYKLYNKNNITYNKYKNVKDSYIGHLNHGNCNNLLYKNSQFL